MEKVNKTFESNISMEKSVEKKTRGKYGHKDPIYYFYVINEKSYKYTPKKKTVKIYCHSIAHIQLVLSKLLIINLPKY